MLTISAPVEVKNIAVFKERSGFEFAEGDICDAELMTALTKRCDAIFHLAAAVGVKLIAEDPVRDENLRLTIDN